MKRYSRKMLSLLVLSILAFSLAAPFMGVNAALSVPTVSDTTVNVGETLNVVGDPDDVTSGATINVYWDIASGASAWLLNTTTGMSDGNYSVQIDIPETASGTHYVWVVDTATGETAKSGPITIVPDLSVDPDEGLPGDELTLDGTGFDDEEQYNVTFWNATISSMVVDVDDDEETDDYGSFTVTFDVPTGWDYGVYGINVSDGTNINITTAFEIGASITITPDEGPRNTVISIEGRGFSESGVIEYGDIKVDGSPGNFTGDAITVDPDGIFTCEINIGNLPYGVHIFTVSDGYYWANATFTVLRNQIDISLYSPENVTIGSIIEVNGVLHWDNGTGLVDRNLLVTYRLVYGTQWNELSVIQTDVNGSFILQWIPQATGEYLLNFELVDGLDNWVDRNKTQVSLVVSEVVTSGFQLNLSVGWNMVSSFDMEVIAEDVFPGFYQLVTWNGNGYVSVDVMEPGKGYWALVLEDTNITITG